MLASHIGKSGSSGNIKMHILSESLDGHDGVWAKIGATCGVTIMYSASYLLGALTVLSSSMYPGELDSWSIPGLRSPAQVLRLVR